MDGWGSDGLSDLAIFGGRPRGLPLGFDTLLVLGDLFVFGRVGDFSGTSGLTACTENGLSGEDGGEGIPIVAVNAETSESIGWESGT